MYSYYRQPRPSDALDSIQDARDKQDYYARSLGAGVYKRTGPWSSSSTSSSVRPIGKLNSSFQEASGSIIAAAASFAALRRHELMRIALYFGIPLVMLHVFEACILGSDSSLARWMRSILRRMMELMGLDCSAIFPSLFDSADSDTELMSVSTVTSRSRSDHAARRSRSKKDTDSQTSRAETVIAGRSKSHAIPRDGRNAINGVSKTPNKASATNKSSTKKVKANMATMAELEESDEIETKEVKGVDDLRKELSRMTEKLQKKFEVLEETNASHKETVAHLMDHIKALEEKKSRTKAVKNQSEKEETPASTREDSVSETEESEIETPASFDDAFVDQIGDLIIPKPRRPSDARRKMVKFGDDKTSTSPPMSARQYEKSNADFSIRCTRMDDASSPESVEDLIQSLAEQSLKDAKDKHRASDFTSPPASMATRVRQDYARSWASSSSSRGSSPMHPPSSSSMSSAMVMRTK